MRLDNLKNDHQNFSIKKSILVSAIQWRNMFAIQLFMDRIVGVCVPSEIVTTEL